MADSDDASASLEARRLRQYQDALRWEAVRQRLEAGELFDTTISSANRTGLLALVDGIWSFIPRTEIVSASDDKGAVGENELRTMIGRTLRVRVIEVNQRRYRVILSERAAAAH